MKPLLLLLLIGFMGGCASEEAPSAEDVRDHFERGISGQGRIVPLGDPEEPIPPPADHPQ